MTMQIYNDIDMSICAEELLISSPCMKKSSPCTYDRTVNVHKACIPQLETGLVIGLWAGRALPALKTS